jgi:hypothetical protein
MRLCVYWNEESNMCVSPTFIYAAGGPKYERLEVACGFCWSCRKNRTNDLVGRCLLEYAACDWCCALTLTYSDLLASADQVSMLHKADFQEFMHKLRRRSKTRYLVAGEYGERFGRPHFHVVLFGYGEPPAWYYHNSPHIEVEPNGWGGREPLWKWGHAYLDRNVSERSIRYVAKYLVKGARRKRGRVSGVETVHKEWVSYSRIPIMGIEEVRRMARAYAEQRLLPRSFRYRPPFADEKREYAFSGEAQYQFLAEFFSIWPEALGMKMVPAMERARLRYVKERVKREWNAMSFEEREKAVDVRRGFGAWSGLNKWLYGSELARRLEDGETWESLREKEPEFVGLCQRAFGRNIGETGCRPSEVGTDTANRLAARGFPDASRGSVPV